LYIWFYRPLDCCFTYTADRFWYSSIPFPVLVILSVLKLKTKLKWRAPPFSHPIPIEQINNYWLCPEISSCWQPRGPQRWWHRCLGRELWLDHPWQLAEKGLGRGLIQRVEQEPELELKSFARALQTRLGLSSGKVSIGFL